MAEPWDRDPSPGVVYRWVAGAIRLMAGAGVALVVGLPLAAAVVVATLLHGPLPVGRLPENQRTITAEASVVLDARGEEIGVFRGFDQTLEVEPDDIPRVLADAVVAIEDQRFWDHGGVDLEGIARAARINLEVGGVVQGGSTITQQYVKNVYLSTEQTIERKVEEALLAVEVEKRLTKDEILYGYLTSSYYGAGAYGIGAAAEIYFDKAVAELDVSEAALLAGVVQAPSRLSPSVDREAADARRRLVLQAMVDQGSLEPEEYERQARRRLWPADEPLPGGPVTLLATRQAKGAQRFPYFVDYVEAELLSRLGPDLVYNGGLIVETTIDPDLQAAAEAAVAARLDGTEHPVEMAAATVIPETGHVVAMVGGRDHGFSQVNLATGGSTGFQAGSSFKPLVLAAAFELGLGPETRYPAPATWDVPGCSGNRCTLANYDFVDRGELTLRAAMRASVNTVFAQLVLDVGLVDTVELSQAFGLSRLDPDRGYGPSLALGSAETSPLEMASAYGTFANGGVRVAPTGILRVIDADGNVLIDNRARPGTRVVSRVTADNVTDVLVGVVESGTGKRAAIGRPVAGKTGTAQEYRAAWFVGYTPDFATAVWMGHADRLAPLRNINGVSNVSGGSHPAVAFAAVMAAAHRGREVREFPEPAEIVPIAETMDELEPHRRREFTEAAPRRAPSVVAGDCGNRACERRAVPLPAVPPADTERSAAVDPTVGPAPMDPAVPTEAAVPAASAGPSAGDSGPVQHDVAADGASADGASVPNP